MLDNIDEDFSKSKKRNRDEDAQADSKSEIREGQGNSSIADEEKENKGTDFPKDIKDKTPYTSQQEYIQEDPNKIPEE